MLQSLIFSDLNGKKEALSGKLSALLYVFLL